MIIRKSSGRELLDPGTKPWTASALYRAVWLTVAVLVLASAALLSERPGDVFAHADYDRSTPGQSESVPEAPTRLDMYTTQDMFKRAGENDLKVFDEAGNRVDDANTVVDDDDRRHLYVGLQPDMPPGRYTVRWTTFSDEDGERFGGGLAFYVGVEPTAEQLLQDQEFEEQAERDFEAGRATAESAPTAGPDEEAPATATSESAATPIQTTASDGADVGSADDEGAPVGLIVGIVVGVVAVVLIGGGFAITRWRRA